MRRMTTLTDLKHTHRATWAAGDYAAVAEHIDAVPLLDLLDRMDSRPGQDVLDVATGTGNVALRAAARGACVVGLDLVPELLRQRRTQERVAAGRRPVLRPQRLDELVAARAAVAVQRQVAEQRPAVAPRQRALHPPAAAADHERAAQLDPAAGRRQRRRNIPATPRCDRRLHHDPGGTS